MDIKVFSFFSGVGLLDLGFENNGYDIVEVFEKKDTFMDMYKFARKKMNQKEPKYGYRLGDVEDFLSNKELNTSVQFEKKDNVVGFIGGPPCPDFSVAGKNKGAEGENGRLSTVYFELIKEYRPDFFLFENVKGIWKTNKNKEYIKSKIEEMKSVGYEVCFDVLNALDFGVPQDRERFFIIGIDKKYVKKRKIDFIDFFSNLHSSEDVKKKYNWPISEPFQEGGQKKQYYEVDKTLSVQYWFDKNDVENHVNAQEYFKPKSLMKFATIEEGDITKKSFKRLHRWRYSPTAAYGNNEVHLHPYYKRRLSVAEVLAIQSAPKIFELPREVTLTDKFKVVGNAVPYLMAEGIARELSLVLKGRVQ